MATYRLPMYQRMATEKARLMSVYGEPMARTMAEQMAKQRAKTVLRKDCGSWRSMTSTSCMNL